MNGSEFFPTARAVAAKKWLDGRLRTLKKGKLSPDPENDAFSAEYALLDRIRKFRFADYPDYTCPWHLLMWPSAHMRWDHVYDVVAIIESLCHVKGAKAGQPIVLEPFQVLLLLCILGPQDPETKLRVVKEGLLTMSRKNAKDLALDTPIPTPSGWTTMGAIQVGDEVLGSDGLPVRVTDVSEVFTGNPCYDVHFSDGTVITAGEGHLWTVAPLGTCTTARLYDSLRTGAQPFVEYTGALRRSGPVEVTDCVPVPSVPTKCIAVDAPDHLFLAGRGGIPTHNTTIVAGLVTALLVLDKDSHGLVGQEIYVGASDRKQAGITFDITNKFIMQDRKLGISKLFRMVPSRKHMTHLSTLTEFEVLSSDAYRAHGLNPAVIIFDETGNVPAGLADEFYSVLTSGYGAQDEPLTILMSTQAASDTHLFSQMVDRCKRVNAGEEEALDVAGFVFETPEQLGRDKLDPHDERWWYLSNPGLGPIVSLQDMRRESEKASALPSLEAKFRNLRLNQRSSPYSPLLAKSAWQKCGGPLDYAALYGRRCWGAIDLSLVKDLTAYVLVFEPDEDGTIPVLPYFWLPGNGIEEKQREDKVPYVMWGTQGWLDLSSATTVNFEYVAQRIQQTMSDYDVQAIGFDRWKVDTVKAKLRDLGLGDIVDNEAFFRPIGQGFRDMSPCVDALEKVILEETLRHGDHPVLTWNAANAVSVSDPAGNRKLDKEKAYGRIDGIVALAMALRLKDIQSLDEDAPSAFESVACLM